MARVRDREKTRLRELEEELRTLRPGDRPALETATEELAQLILPDRIGAYSFRIEDQRLEPEVSDISGAPCGRIEARRRLEDFLERNQRTPGAYDAARPHPKQRNRIVLLPPTVEFLYELEERPGPWEAELGISGDAVASHLRENFQPFLRPTGFDQHQMRVLLCDGESVLGYLGAAQNEPFTERQRLLLKTITRPLRDRLKLEQQLRDAPLAAAAFEAALEAIPAPAFLVTGGGAIRAMNGAGAFWSAGRPRRLTELLRASVQGERTTPAFRVRRIEVSGFPDYFLAVKELGEGATPGRMAVARSRWGLTKRQTEVLARVVRGDTNKAIAVGLALGQSTVELHITKILEKADAASRSELIARFWNLRSH